MNKLASNNFNIDKIMVDNEYYYPKFDLGVVIKKIN